MIYKTFASPGTAGILGRFTGLNQEKPTTHPMAISSFDHPGPNSEPEERPALGAHHIVLVHGLGRTQWSMWTLGRRLRRKGFIVHNFGYFSLFSDIKHAASKLSRFLAKRVPPDSQLSFVTHSLGGIIVRSYISRIDNKYSHSRAVMLAPPNMGSSIARLVQRIPVAGRILGPAFRELQALDMPHTTDQIEIGVIAGGKLDQRGYFSLLEGDNDGIVTVSETKLPGMKDHIVMRGVHSFLMYDKCVLHQIVSFLKHGHFDRQRLR